jgi:peptidyl-tRNA hydrolase, PTH1 family
MRALIVGLGNPGSQYARTRHNVGFMVIDLLAQRAGATLRGKYNALFCETRLAGEPVGLLEPQTFMNLSGASAASAARFFKLPAEAVIVVYDDIDVAFGRVRARLDGGLKGHNGLRSMTDALGSSGFVRVRCGVGRPGRGDPRSVADYVLAPFGPDEDALVMVERAADCVELLVRDGVEEAQHAYP